jgi:hypothetical protein
MLRLIEVDPTFLLPLHILKPSHKVAIVARLEERIRQNRVVDALHALAAHHSGRRIQNRIEDLLQESAPAVAACKAVGAGFDRAQTSYENAEVLDGIGAR